MREFRIYCYIFLLVNTFVDFKDCSSLCKVIYRKTYLTDAFMVIIFYEFTSPDILHIIHQLGATNYLSETSTYDIMLYLNIVLLTYSIIL